uniref:Uncharacterized protein n=1 Tax=Erpetoichthys calabaricus TaxID=27687 RepID=A0A8C4SUT7_ERPCA
MPLKVVSKRLNRRISWFLLSFLSSLMAVASVAIISFISDSSLRLSCPASELQLPLQAHTAGPFLVLNDPQKSAIHRDLYHLHPRSHFHSRQETTQWSGVLGSLHIRLPVPGLSPRGHTLYSGQMSVQTLIPSWYFYVEKQSF